MHSVIHGRQPLPSPPPHTRSVHVVYINTSLRTKARAHALVPTITCTSSNVVQTVLAAFADVPGATVWYGPDTYMGANLAQLFADLASGAASDDDVRALHPAHTVDSIRCAGVCGCVCVWVWVWVWVGGGATVGVGKIKAVEIGHSRRTKPTCLRPRMRCGLGVGGFGDLWREL